MWEAEVFVCVCVCFSVREKTAACACVERVHVCVIRPVQTLPSSGFARWDRTSDLPPWNTEQTIKCTHACTHMHKHTFKQPDVAIFSTHRHSLLSVVPQHLLTHTSAGLILQHYQSLLLVHILAWGKHLDPYDDRHICWWKTNQPLAHKSASNSTHSNSAGMGTSFFFYFLAFISQQFRQRAKKAAQVKTDKEMNSEFISFQLHFTRLRHLLLFLRDVGAALIKT